MVVSSRAKVLLLRVVLRWGATVGAGAGGVDHDEDLGPKANAVLVRRGSAWYSLSMQPLVLERCLRFRRVGCGVLDVTRDTTGREAEARPSTSELMTMSAKDASIELDRSLSYLLLELNWLFPRRDSAECVGPSMHRIG